MGGIGLTLFFGLFLAVGIAILGFGLRSMYMANTAANWPTVQGEIVSANFSSSTDDEGSTTYRNDISYDYSVGGVSYTSKKIAFGYSGSSSYSFHREIEGALPVSSQVAVRYDPSKPDRAVLSFGGHQSILFLIIFGSVWTMFTLGMMAMFWLSESGAGSLVDNILVYSRG